MSIWGKQLQFIDVTGSETINVIQRDLELDVYGCQHLTPQPETIVDLGAHVGMFSILMSKQYLDAKICAVEPMTNNYECLRQNITLNQAKVTPIKAAIGDGKMMSLFQHPKNSGMCSQFNWPDYQSEKVRTFLLDDLLRHIKYSKVDLLKVDIEGAEYLALNTFEGWDKIGRLAIELHGIAQLTKEENDELQVKCEEFIYSKLPRDRVCLLSDSKWVVWGETRAHPHLSL